MSEIDSGLWTVIGIIPIAMFFVLFTIFGGFMRSESSPSINTTPSYFTETGHVVDTPLSSTSNTFLKRILLSIGLARKVEKK